MKLAFPLLLAAWLAGCSAPTPPPPPDTPSPYFSTAIPSSTPTPEAAPALKVSQSDFKLAFYPNAKLVGGGKMETSDGVTCSADLQTADAQAAVVAYYQKLLPKARKQMEKTPDAIRVILSDEHNTITISPPNKGATRINVTEQP